MIKYGTTRTVFLIGKYAFKFPSFGSWKHFLLGLLGNMNESTFSNVKEFQNHLCPVVFKLPGGFLTVMRRAEPLPREEFEIALEIDWPIEAIEMKMDSFGKLNGSIVAVDYG